MSPGSASAILFVLTSVAVCLGAPRVDAATRTLLAPFDVVWKAARSALAADGWTIESEDRRTGTIVTAPRDIAVQQAGMYAEGVRQALKLTLRAAGTAMTSVAVDREMFWEERFLWDARRWPRPTDRRDAADRREVEERMIDRIRERAGDSAVAATAPAAAGTAPVTSPRGAPAASPPALARETPPAVLAAARPPLVTYRITGNGTPVQVTYRDVGGTSVSHVAATLPWELSFEGRGTVPLYVSGVGEGAGAVSLSCEILVDGRPQSQSMSVGASAAASCSAPLP